MNDLKRFDEALAHFDRAIEIKPDYAEALLNKGVTLNDLNQLDGALFHYEEALRLKPNYEEAMFNRAILRLNLKNFVEGWRDFEVRIKDKKIINFEFPFNVESVPVWDGVIPCKHLLVICEQGVGDQIFYASMLHQIQAKVEEITVSIDERLISVFSRSFPAINFFGKQFKFDENLFDAQIALGSLPRILDANTPKMILVRQPYLIDNYEFTSKLKNSSIFKNKFTCGLSWKSSNKKIGNQKSIELMFLREILQIPGCSFINLQYGDISEEVNDVAINTNIRLQTIKDIDVFSDMDGLLSIIKSCDIVITTSNITAHLAGASGKKTLLLLPYSQGRIWYWHKEAVSTWYPNIKQYFQDFDRGWGKAIKEIAAELRCEIDRKN